MAYEGDITAGSLLNFKFSTNNTSAVPTTLAGTPVVSVYKNASTTESTAGASLTVDFDGRTGLNAVTIDTSADGTFYAAGNDYQVVITAGTVGGTSVVGAIVGEFSIQNRTQYADVRKILGTASAGAAGYMGVDWGQIANPTTTQALSATTVRTVTTLAANAIAGSSFQNNSITGAALAASAASILATAVWQDTTAGDFTVAGSIGKSLFTSGNAPGAASGLALVGSNMGTVSSVTGNVGGNVVGSVGSISGITFPTNFGALGISSGGHIVTVDTTTAITNGGDGLSFTSIQELLIAFIAGKATYVDNGDGTATLTFKKQDGTTTKYTVTFNKTTGARTASTIS